MSKLGGGTVQKIGGILTNVTGAASQLSPLGRIGSAVEPFLGGLAGGGKGGAAGAAVNALGGLLGGSSGGASPLGGIGGMLGGAGLQALSGALGRGGAPGAITSALGGMLSGSPGGPTGALTSLFGGTRAIDQLMSLSQRPEMAMALGALGLGKLGRQSIDVGPSRVQVPTAAFPNLYAQLADQVVTEAAELAGDSESELTYMVDSSGEYVGDPGFARDRASRVWDLLNEAQAERLFEYIAGLPAMETQAVEYERDLLDQAEAYARQTDEAYYDAMDLQDAEAIESELEAAWPEAEGLVDWEMTNERF
jgi:hypothetical protein